MGVGGGVDACVSTCIFMWCDINSKQSSKLWYMSLTAGQIILRSSSGDGVPGHGLPGNYEDLFSSISVSVPK